MDFKSKIQAIRRHGRRSVLFVRPDYHCSFVLRDEFRKSGWKSSIFVPSSYPERLLYSDLNIIKDRRRYPRRGRLSIRNPIFNFLYSLLTLRFKYHIYYGRPPEFSFGEDSVTFRRVISFLFGSDFVPSLSIARLFGCKLVYLPSGCNDAFLKSEFQLFDAGNVCGNCGFYERCVDSGNQLNLDRVDRYFHGVIGDGTTDFPQLDQTHLPWKSIDLDHWATNTPTISNTDQVKKDVIKILHSHSLESRSLNGKNIKGTPAILRAVERLKREGHPVEIVEITGVPSRDMRFYQATADIIVDQLTYGWWGSTGIEAMALGKPLVCYLRPDWKDRFLRTFPRISKIPVIEANVATIESVLRQLVLDPEFRNRAGKESREFAELQFDPAKNTVVLSDFLTGL